MYEDTLTKALQVEMDEDIPAYPTDHRLEEQLENVQNYLVCTKRTSCRLYSCRQLSFECPAVEHLVHQIS